jgi:hypothetical protein
MSLIDQIVGVESGGNPYATNPRSSATGAGQFIDSTWLSLIGKYRPDLAEGKSPQDILALRTDPVLSKEMVGNYAKDNAEILTKAGLPTDSGATYLAHFAGPQGAVKVLGADPATPIAAILGQAAVKANPFLANMTAGDLVGWAGKKMGATPKPSAPAVAPPQPALGAVGMAQAQPAALPLFAAPAQPLPAPQQQAQAQPADYFAQLPAQPDPLSIPMMKRRPVKFAQARFYTRG